MCEDVDWAVPVVGSAQGGNEQVEEDDMPVGILYLPDPGQETGILTRWIKRQKPGGPVRRAGFRPYTICHETTHKIG